MRKRILSVLLTLCMVLTLLPTVALAAEPDGCGAPARGGQIEVLGLRAGSYTALARLTFTKNISTQTIEIASPVEAIKVVKLSGYEANLDELTLEGVCPAGYERKLSATDNDLIEVEDETEFALSGSGTLTVSARVPMTVPDINCSFKFPESNLYHPITSESDFYNYTLGTNSGAFATGETLTVPDAANLFYDEMAYPGTGHPAAPMQIYLADDGQTLYAFFEVFLDNTYDHGKDFAAVHIKDGDTVKSYAVHTTEENEYGRWYFDYTDNAAGITWQHMCYVIAVPLNELESSASELELAFEYYGTGAIDPFQALVIDGKQIGTRNPGGSDECVGDYALPAEGHYLNSDGEDSASGFWWLSYDGTEYTLTLNGANLTTSCSCPGYVSGSAGLIALGNLNIVLAEGTTNTIGTSGMEYAMCLWGYTASISGAGTLNLYGKKYVLSSGGASLTITDATVNVTASTNDSNTYQGGISTNGLSLNKTEVTVTATNTGTPGASYHLIGVNVGDDGLQMTNSTLTATASTAGAAPEYALYNYGAIQTDAYVKYYEGDAAPGSAVNSLADLDNSSTGLQSRPYVKIVSKGSWLDTDGSGAYKYADFSWANNATNNGTEAHPYLIADAADLAGLAALVNGAGTLTSALPGGSSAAALNFSGKFIKLTGDIDLGGKLWTPIGRFNSKQFMGTLDGGGHEISGLDFAAGVSDGIALFGGIGTEGTVANLRVAVAIDFTHYSNYRGGILCDCNYGVIDSCHTSGSIRIDSTSSYGGGGVGGIVCSNMGVIRNCSNAASVTGDGANDGNSMTIGGIASGNYTSGEIINCYNTGNLEIVTGEYQYCGGIVGTNNNSCVIANCYNTGTTTAASNTGGIAGTNTATITDCYYKSDATDNDPSTMTETEMKASDFVAALNAYVTANQTTPPTLMPWVKTSTYPTLMSKAAPVIGEFTVTQPTASSATGSIVPVDVTIEYQYYDGSVWSDLPTGGLANIPAGSYQIRYKATQSDALTVTITAYNPPTPVLGGGGGAGSKALTVPVTGSGGSVQASAEVSGKTATIDVTDAQLGKLTSGDGAVTVDVSSIKVDAAVIPAKLASQAEEIEVVLSAGTVELDSAALESAGGKSITVCVETVAASDLSSTQKSALGDDTGSCVIVDVNVLVNGVKTSEFGGGVITIGIPYAATAGEDTSKLAVYYLADDGSVTKMSGHYDAGKKAYIFTTTHLSTYVLMVQKETLLFDDVTVDDWFYSDVAYVSASGLMKGTGATVFDPSGTITRGMIAEILFRMAGEPAVTGKCPFDDVATGAYYEHAVVWAAENNIVSGFGNGKFAPEATITREQMAAMLYRYEQFKGGGFTGSWMFRLDFADADSVSKWAYEAMCWCTMKGIISGVGEGMLAPGNSAQRCQAAAILHRFCENPV